MQLTSVENLEQLLAGQPGLSELRALLALLLSQRQVRSHCLHAENLQSQRGRVYRLNFSAGGNTAASFVVKRLDPSTARRTELLAHRWLPAVGLSECAPELLGIAAEANGRCVWHVYEHAGEGALAAEKPDLMRVRVATEAIALLHTRFAGHPLLAETRLYGGDFGIKFFAANLRDAIRCLDGMNSKSLELSMEELRLRDRLRDRLADLLDEVPRRREALAEFGGPETLLHGDLWTTNIFVTATSTGLRARLIDWDHVGVGPVSYDLSTFLLRWPAGFRPQILEMYREAVGESGWQLPSEEILNLLFETAEYGRFANRIIWPAIALVNDRAEWAMGELAEVEGWFEQWRPVLAAPKEAVAQAS